MAPTHFVKETDNYWVLQEYASKSSSSVHQVRTSKNDDKTYCTCRGWIVKLNQSKADGSRPECTHIKQYKKGDKTREPIVVMNFDDFVRVKRANAMLTPGNVPAENNVRRSR